MKKILIAALALALAFIDAGAQITVKSQREASTVITRFRSGVCSLRKDQDGLYYLVLVSSNRFDDPAIVFVGDSGESAAETLSGIADLIDSMKKGDSVKFDVMDTFEYEVYKHNALSSSFSIKGYAGSIWITPNELRKCSEAVQEQKED